VQITVKVEPQQIRRIVRRRAGVLDDGMSKAQRAQIQVRDEGVQKRTELSAQCNPPAVRQEQGLVAIQSAAMVRACQTYEPARCSKRCRTFYTASRRQELRPRT